MEKALSFYLVADTHYFETSLGASGKKYDEYMQKQQMCLGENSSIVSATFEKIGSDTETEIVIIPGDLVKNGELESHRSFIKELRKLQENGKKIYVTTALHDFEDEPIGYIGDEFVTVEGTKREQLPEMYKDFGFSNSIAFDKISYSYVAQLNDEIRMLAINCDGYDGVSGEINDRLIDWMKVQIDDARKNNCFIFAVNHYPIIPACPVFEFVSDAKVKNNEKIAEFLADNGVNLIFTGHMHIQSIKKYISQKGNKLYDVCTGALVGSPAKYRKITFRINDTVEIESVDVPDFEYGGKIHNAREYCDRQFSHMIGNLLIDMMADGKGVVGHLKKTVAKIVDKWTLGRVGKLLWFSVDKSIRKVKLKDFIVQIILNLFSGELPYVEGTAQYRFFQKFLSRLSFVIEKVESKLTEDVGDFNLKDAVFNIIGNNTEIDNNNAVIKLK